MKLNLGSGYRKLTNYVNIDNRPECDPDLLHDLTDPLPYEESSIDEVRAVDILEHIPIGRTVGLIGEIWRVLKPGGYFYSMTPSTDGRGAFQDPTHMSFWNANSWLYYMDDLYRNLYGIRAKFEGRIYDKITDMNNRIIHTLGELYAVK